MIDDELIKDIIDFRDQREWKQFHSIKDLCLGLGIEVAELQEIFLWKTDTQVSSIQASEKEKISEELADIFIFLSYLSNDLGINLEKAVRTKIVINSEKYPVSKSKGVNTKYNKL